MARAWPFAASVLLCGCQLVHGFEQFEYGTGAAGSAGAPGNTGGSTGQAGTAAAAGQAGYAGSAGSSAGGAAGQAACALVAPTRDARPMAAVTRADGTCFLIDETEVSRGAYDAFVADSANHKPEPARCAGNMGNYAPSCTPRWSEPPTPGATLADMPVVCVDQCDALAYCAWAGKSLCKNAQVEGKTQSDWRRACDGGEGRVYTYGKTLDKSACSSTSKPGFDCTAAMKCSAFPVGSQELCVSREGAHDLSGNVEEWTDECPTDGDFTSGSCYARGGSFATSGGDITCDAGTEIARNSARDTLGFRCCSYE